MVLLNNFFFFVQCQPNGIALLEIHILISFNQIIYTMILFILSFNILLLFFT